MGAEADAADFSANVPLLLCLLHALPAAQTHQSSCKILCISRGVFYGISLTEGASKIDLLHSQARVQSVQASIGQIPTHGPNPLALCDLTACCCYCCCCWVQDIQHRHACWAVWHRQGCIQSSLAGAWTGRALKPCGATACCCCREASRQAAS